MNERSGFVTTLAKTGIVASVILFLLQIIGLLPDGPPTPQEQDLLAMIPPELMQSLTMESNPAFELTMTGFTLVCIVVCWFLLQRKEWARKGFIGVLIASIALHVYGAFWMMQRFEHIAEVMLGNSPTRRAIDAVARIETIFDSVVVIFTVLVCILFAWLGWKLQRPVIREEFSAAPRQ